MPVLVSLCVITRFGAILIHDAAFSNKGLLKVTKEEMSSSLNAVTEALSFSQASVQAFLDAP